MGGLFTYKDGRLKTGRVATIFFVLLLACIGLFFKISRPVDHVLVSVKHLFEPKEEKTKIDKEKIAPKSEDQMAKAEKKPAVPGKAEKKEEPLAASQAHKPQTPEIPDPSPAKIQETVPQAVDTGTKKADNSQNAAVQKTEDSRSPVVEAGRLSDLLGSPGDKASEQKEPPKTDLDVSKKLGSLVGRKEEPDKEKPKISTALKTTQDKAGTNEAAGSREHDTSTPKPIQVDHVNRAITVDSGQYMALYKSWNAAGSNGKSEEKIPLRVENLKAAYDLFQMKPVAVVRNQTFVDLTDGVRVVKASLEDYSGTVFRVDNPREKWGEELKAFGVRSTDKVEVRYYMYDFIKDAIFSRANQAFECCREQGLIDSQTPPSEVDVLGRAYIIKRRGGGRFGIFVPVSLNTIDGRNIKIDADCFRGQPDIEALKEAGMF